MAHLKQVSVALFMLADDSEGYLGAPYIGTNWWYDAMKPYLGDLSKTLVYGLVQNRNLACPTYKYGGGLNDRGVYGLNPQFSYDTGSGGPHPLREVNRLTTTILISDFISTEGYYTGGFDLTCLGSSGDVYPRHEGRGLNCIFVDGHGEFLKYLSGNSFWNQAPPAGEPAGWYCGYGNHLRCGP